MRQIHQYQLDQGRCTALNPGERTTLTVVTGKLWLTTEGQEMDHWLSAGDTMVLPPRHTFWLSAETGALELQLSIELAPSRLPSRGAGLSLGLGLGRSLSRTTGKSQHAAGVP